MTRSIALALGALAFAFAIHIPDGNAKGKTKEERAWTLQDTINHTLSHSSAIKRELESVNIARENERQAEAGHYPRVNVEGSGGLSTLPVSRNE